jgi:putative aldouronate transport system permease protein
VVHKVDLLQSKTINRPAKVKLSKEEKKKLFKKNIKRDKLLLLMFLPVLIYYIVFCYFPMTGLVMAFQKFTPGKGIMGLYTGDFVGLKWFNQFFKSPYAWRLISNTFLLSFYSLIFGFPIPIIFALCITQVRNKFIQKFSQVITYLPYFISTVVVAGMVVNFLSPTTGIINNFIQALGGSPINFMNEPKWFRAIYVISGSWQTFGFNSIIFVAAIMGISPELDEAMRVDGATKRQIIWHLILPSIRPTIVLLLIMSLGNLLNVGFEKVYLLYNSAIYNTADVISTYVYRQGIESKNFSYATAVGLFNSLIGFVIVFSANKLSRKISDTSVW